MEPSTSATATVAIVQAIGNGEIDAGLVNHYYVYAVGREAGEDFPVANHFFAARGPWVADQRGRHRVDRRRERRRRGTGVCRHYLLSDEGKEYFATETFEYPLIEGVAAPEGLVPLSEIGHPDIELGDLADLRGTLDLLSEVGLV